ncbi:DUF6761 family protein [Prochlorococcus sp. MIT 1223]|uniref:DUF6761 family protein n=1 Tax=Prochlorococcus sp. MIT 1223 TaxID=3096217 RepID=UPI002A750570|nr:DUF6761 family protein [Prochlorococcus sp. MIT 1223]
MTSFDAPETIRHFQSICDACQDLVSKYHTQSDLRLYADGYLNALRNCRNLERKDQEKLEKVIEKWILDPSSFIGPDGDIRNLFFQKEF